MTAAKSREFWPFVPTNPNAWKALRERWPVGMEFLGHDGELFYFGEIGNPEHVRVPMSRRAKREVAL